MLARHLERNRACPFFVSNPDAGRQSKSPHSRQPCLPGLWVLFQAATDDLGARPVTEAIHQVGDWTLRLLLITLAITPAQRILHYPRIILARRTLGVATAVYASLHLCLYVLDQHFDLIKVGSEIVLRIFLIGALALAGLIALAVTSTDAAIRRLGSQRWNLLHRLVYAIALLAAVHFFIQSKLNIYEPVLMTDFAVAPGIPRPLLAKWRSDTSSSVSTGRCRGGGTPRGSADLHVHQRSGWAPRAARPFRFRHGSAARPGGCLPAALLSQGSQPGATNLSGPAPRIVPQVMRGAAQAQTAAE